MRLYKRIKNVSSLVLIILLFGGSISNIITKFINEDINTSSPYEHTSLSSLSIELLQTKNDVILSDKDLIISTPLYIQYSIINIFSNYYQYFSITSRYIV